MHLALTKFGVDGGEMENKAVLGVSRRDFFKVQIQRSCLDPAEGEIQCAFSGCSFPTAPLFQRNL